MPTPGEAVAAIAEVFGLTKTTVAQHDRNLAVAGLRTKTGRGSSSAQMSPLDLGGIATAVAASPQVKDSVKTWSEYAPLQTREGHVWKHGVGGEKNGGKWELPFLPIPRLQSLPEDHTFLQAVAGLIAAAANGSLQEAMQKPAHDRALPMGMTIVEVSFFGPYPQAVIRVISADNEEKHYRHPSLTGNYKVDVALSHDLHKNYPGDLAQVRSFGLKTILKLGSLLRGDRYRGCDESGLPLDPDHPWNKNLPPPERARRLEEIEEYLAKLEAGIKGKEKK